MLKVLHTADTHLGYKQYHKPERETDFKQAFEAVITEGIQADVDVVIHSGDIFHRSRPGITTLSYFFEQLKRLQENGIEFCTIVGNHDSTRDRQWPELVEDLGLGVYLDKNGYEIGDVCFYGVDHISKRNRGGLDYQFKQSDSSVNVFVGHGLFKPFSHGDWDLTEVATKSNIQFDAFLLGDNHKAGIETVNGAVTTYPGSTERTAADQREQRGYNQVRIVDGEVSVSHAKIETREFEYVDVDLDEGEGTEKIVNVIESMEISNGSVVIVTVEGVGERVSSGMVEKAGLRKGAMVVRVNDRRDIERNKNSFEGVEFTSPDDVIQDRIEELGLSNPSGELEEMARQVEQNPKSKLTDTAEEVVGELIKGGEIDMDEVNTNDLDEKGMDEDEQMELAELEGEQ
jgi:DNA repair exonuclease SbcCD nuclease subunit